MVVREVDCEGLNGTLAHFVYIPIPRHSVCNSMAIKIQLSRRLPEMGNRGGVAVILLLCLLFAYSARAFYLPGVAPRNFHKDDELQVKVNKLSSMKTQLPYDYYFLEYCNPTQIMNSAENLGEVLRGDRIENSVYTFKMRNGETCKVACRVRLNSEAAKNFKEKIEDENGLPIYDGEGKTLLDRMEFHESDFLAYCRDNKIELDRIVGCLSVYIGNPSYNVNEDDIRERFAINETTGAFEASAMLILQKAMGKNQIELHGRPMKIAYAVSNWH